MTVKNYILTSILVLCSASAYGTNGYFTHGRGVKSQGMGGVGIALAHDTLSIASNPASASWLGDRLDVGTTWFRPDRIADIRGNAMADGRYDANETQNFLIPEFGYNHEISDRLSLAVTVYGHGGLNTDYDRPIPLLGNTRAGVDLAQAFITPTLSWKLNEKHSIGVSLNIAYQRFEASGLQNFDDPAFSSAPGYVTNRGHDHSYGAGVQIGWQGHLTEALTVGASYQSRTYMTEFDDYKGLFAEKGGFDIPATYGVGISVKATPKLTIAAEIQRIEYGEVDSVGEFSLSTLLAGNALGADNGPGFGWRDVNVYKLGVSHKWSQSLTLRAGYDHVTQPIRRGETLFNMLAPGVVRNHFTLGATWSLNKNSEVSFAYMHAFNEKVKGYNSIPQGFGGGEVDLQMSQHALGIAYGRKF